MKAELQRRGKGAGSPWQDKLAVPVSTHNNQCSPAQPGTVMGNNWAVCQLVESKRNYSLKQDLEIEYKVQVKEKKKYKGGRSGAFFFFFFSQPPISGG